MVQPFSLKVSVWDLGSGALQSPKLRLPGDDEPHEKVFGDAMCWKHAERQRSKALVL